MYLPHQYRRSLRPNSAAKSSTKSSNCCRNAVTCLAFIIPITLHVHPLTSVVPGKYAMRGTLRYQACDNAQCFPPKTLPVNFDVKVVKQPAAHHKNPAQSPHAHK